MRRAEDVLGKQRQAYETQCQRMAREHESCVERMRLENERMLEEAAKVPQPSMVDIILSQARVYNDVMAKRLDLKTKRHLDDYVAGKHRRERKEEDLRLAEEQIAKLKKHLRQLEDIIDGTTKRPMPPREEGDSSEMHVNKRGRTDELPPLALTQGNDPHNSEPVITRSSAVPHVPILVEPLPRREPIRICSNLLDSTVSNVPVLNSLALSATVSNVSVLDSTVSSVPVLDSPALDRPKKAPERPRRFTAAPSPFAPTTSPLDSTGCTADMRGCNRFVSAPDKTRPAYRMRRILRTQSS
jgi:hypothetical protein